MRRALPKMDFMKNKHEDCANFDNGTCRFFHFTNLDPKGQACPHFKAKDKSRSWARGLFSNLLIKTLMAWKSNERECCRYRLHCMQAQRGFLL
jgi:hypothetical protein